jgi:hypothetical protein
MYLSMYSLASAVYLKQLNCPLAVYTDRQLASFGHSSQTYLVSEVPTGCRTHAAVMSHIFYC